MSIKDLRKVIRKPSTWNHATIPRYQIEKALEEYDGLRAALETIAAWPFDIMGDCVADARKLAQTALRGAEEGE